MAQPALVLPNSPADRELVRLLAEARQAWSDGNVRWAEALARRARCFDPRGVEAAKLQCALLGKLGRVEQALAIADQFAESADRELVLMRARMACELQRWDDAQRICETLPEPPPSLLSRIQLAGATA